MIHSSDKGAMMLELYTSQGCYSCPPAEEWINEFTSDPGLWKTIIPINLHVDYWDYLGWKDPFARAEFSKRQRIYNKLRHTRNVATPGFVVNGKGWDGWFRRQALTKRPLANKGKLIAKIDGTDVDISFRPKEDQYRAPYVHVAILGFGIETDIPRGENAGETLKHDFVVVGYEKNKMTRKTDQWASWVYLPRTVKTEMKQQAIAVWVTELDDPAPLQVAANWL